MFDTYHLLTRTFSIFFNFPLVIAFLIGGFHLLLKLEKYNKFIIRSIQFFYIVFLFFFCFTYLGSPLAHRDISLEDIQKINNGESFGQKVFVFSKLNQREKAFSQACLIDAHIKTKLFEYQINSMPIKDFDPIVFDYITIINNKTYIKSSAIYRKCINDIKA